VAPNIPGFLHKIGALTTVPPVFDTIYTYAWFVGLILSATVHGLGMMLWRPPGMTQRG